MPTYNHAYTLAFSVPHCWSSDSEYTVINEREKVIAALLRRVSELADNPRELEDALGVAFDTFEEDN